MTLSFPDHLTKWELSDAYREAYLQEQRVVPHVIVEDGPVLENVMMGDEVDVTKFPAPKWHEKDGGRYIGTGTYTITRDPEENWLNAGAYRAQVHDKKTVGMVMAAGHHGRIHRDKAFKRGEPLPAAMVLGGDPIAFFFGGLEAPYGVFELDLVGGLRGRPVKMVRGKVTGLPFPANAEIVLEGYVPPDRTHAEGPFGEWTGHYAGGMRQIPVLDIKAIYHRNDPIVLGVPPMGGGPDEMARYRAVMRSATIKQNVANARVPGVQAVWCHEVGGARMPRALDHAALSGTRGTGRPCRRPVRRLRLCVEIHRGGGRRRRRHQSRSSAVGDADPHRSEGSIQFITGSWDSSADPALPPERRAVGNMTHSVALIDACKPWHWRDKFPPPMRRARGDPQGARKVRLAARRQRRGDFLPRSRGTPTASRGTPVRFR